MTGLTGADPVDHHTSGGQVWFGREIDAYQAGAAAERRRITLALLGCVTCGEIHQKREIPAEPGRPRHSWAHPGDGHAYRERLFNREGKSIAALIGGGQP